MIDFYTAGTADKADNLPHLTHWAAAMAARPAIAKGMQVSS
jgi:hypothetical protein